MKKLLLLTLFCLPVYLFAQPGARYIVIDQFGYLPDAKKTAVIRDPQIGFDADESYLPGIVYSLIDATSGDTVYSGVASAWKSGNTDESSGDKVWHFDFSEFSEPGSYYILDEERGQRSYEFVIAHNVYNEVLKQAVRTFFYQRVGFPKEAQYAGEAWADGASHIGSGQDLECRSFMDQENTSLERDVSGGWYDAGDFNKYTSWTANYVVSFMKAYLDNPEAFSDDYNIPESGNGIPDILDEARWGIDHLLRMQLGNGSVLSIVGEAHGSPPSSATGRSYYGDPSTNATANTAAAFALASKVYSMIGQTDYADTLLSRAIKAWEWANVNPSVIFRNNDSNAGTSGLGAGQQETDDYGRLCSRIEAACYLFELTDDTKYRDFFDDNYESVNMMQWSWIFPFQNDNQEMLLYYTGLSNGTASVQQDILNVYENSMKNSSTNYPAISGMVDPYLAFLDSYTWGSNSVKATSGLMFMNMIHYSLDNANHDKYRDAGQFYVNYIHGVNPLSLVYLSNMSAFGAENSVREFYHSWFKDGSEKWDAVGESTYGPPPGFVPGGANPSYDWDGCCPGSCGSTTNNAVCSSLDIYPPKGQPEQKSYKQFNTSWPLNSWSVTENSCGYQLSYIRLLSHFVTAGVDCHGDAGGTAFIDSCGTCAGGNTGLIPELDPDACQANIDCNGIENGAAFIDSCGICSGGSTGRIPVLDREECYDCNGDFNGEAILDSCGLCAGGNTGVEPILDPEECKDCNGDFLGTAYLDSCGLCSAGNTGREPVMNKESCYDCNEDFNGTAVLDSCGICAGGNTSRVPVLVKEECYDCNAVFNGIAFIDSCGNCTGGDTGETPVLDPDLCNSSVGNHQTPLSIYPNPTTDILIIQPLEPGRYELQILDIQGRQVMNTMFNSTIDLNISHLQPGFYEILILSRGLSYHKKLLVQ